LAPSDWMNWISRVRNLKTELFICLEGVVNVWYISIHCFINTVKSTTLLLRLAPSDWLNWIARVRNLKTEMFYLLGWCGKSVLYQYSLLYMYEINNTIIAVDAKWRVKVTAWPGVGGGGGGRGLTTTWELNCTLKTLLYQYSLYENEKKRKKENEIRTFG
jgi:hypothetical protein